MKKSISLVLCLAMLVSVFSCLGVTASAAGDAQALFTVKAGDVKNDKITYTVYINKGVNLSGAVIYAKFDSDVLAIDKANSGPYMTTDSYGDECPGVDGEYEADFMAGYDDQFSIAHVYGPEVDYKAGSSNKPYMQFTFKVTDDNRPATTVKFYCYEFYSISAPENIIENGSSALVASVKQATLGQTALTGVACVEGGLEISWKKTPGADGYYVYKKINDSYQSIATVEDADQVTYTDTDVAAGEACTYTVRAFNESGLNSGYDKTGISATYVIASASIEAEIDVNSVVVTWSKAAGATSYRLYRRIVNTDGTTGSWESFDKTTGTTMTDSSSSLKSGNKYEYAVRSYSSSTYSSLSEPVAITYLATPKVTVKSVYKGVQVSWGKISGAEKYRVYRKVYGTSKWVAVKTVGADTLSYTDTGATNNKKIYYTVKVVNEDAVSAYKGVSVQYIKAPKATVSNVKSGVKISWGKISGASKYYVYRKKGSASSWTKIATVTSTSYTDKNVKNNTTYKYTVRAANSSRTSGYYSTGWKTKFFSAPKLSSVSSAKSGITFKWSKVTGATQYDVYRKTGSAGYKKIATVKGSTKVSYLDKSAKKGKTYTYTVRATNGSYTSYYNTGLKIKDKY